VQPKEVMSKASEPQDGTGKPTGNLREPQRSTDDQMEHHGIPWNLVEGHGTLWKVMESPGKF